ncbi:hypothetical protein D3C75_558190 [compost metagenome]
MNIGIVLMFELFHANSQGIINIRLNPFEYSLGKLCIDKGTDQRTAPWISMITLQFFQTTAS